MILFECLCLGYTYSYVQKVNIMAQGTRGSPMVLEVLLGVSQCSLGSPRVLVDLPEFFRVSKSSWESLSVPGGGGLQEFSEVFDRS